MHHQRMALFVAVLLSAGVARGEGVESNVVDLTAKLDHGIAELESQVGPIAFHQILLQNVPTADELSAAAPKDKTRPKPVLLFDNVSFSKVRVDLKVQLLDEAGVVLLSCSFADSLAPAWKEDRDDLCGHRETLLTRDWPRVQTIRVVGTIAAPQH